MFVDIKVKCFKEFFDVYVSFVYGLADRHDTRHTFSEWSDP